MNSAASIAIAFASLALIVSQTNADVSTASSLSPCYSENEDELPSTITSHTGSTKDHAIADLLMANDFLTQYEVRAPVKLHSNFPAAYQLLLFPDSPNVNETTEDCILIRYYGHNGGDNRNSSAILHIVNSLVPKTFGILDFSNDCKWKEIVLVRPNVSRLSQVRIQLMLADPLDYFTINRISFGKGNNATCQLQESDMNYENVVNKVTSTMLQFVAEEDVILEQQTSGPDRMNSLASSLVENEVTTLKSRNIPVELALATPVHSESANSSKLRFRLMLDDGRHLQDISHKVTDNPLRHRKDPKRYLYFILGFDVTLAIIVGAYAVVQYGIPRYRKWRNPQLEESEV